MPYIIDRCLGDVIDRSAKRCSNFKGCGSNALGIITTFNSFTCACAGDPQGDAELAGTDTNGHLWHARRDFDGSWTQFADVESFAGDMGTVSAVDLQHVGTDTHVVAVKGETGRLCYSRRLSATGAWTPFFEMTTGAIANHVIQRVGMGALGGDLHVLARSNQGVLLHGLRNGSGQWTQFNDVSAFAGQTGSPFVGAGHAAGLASDLHVCAVTGNGKVWHTVRSTATGGWTSFGDVKAIAGNVGSFTEVDCVAINNDLHLVGFTPVGGGIWHTIRSASGSWTPFRNVRDFAGDPGVIVRIAAFAAVDTLQLTVRKSDGALRHTMRLPDGIWTLFADVNAFAGNPGSFVDIGMN
jgi:hypothetical protein